MKGVVHFVVLVAFALQHFSCCCWHSDGCAREFYATSTPSPSESQTAHCCCCHDHPAKPEQSSAPERPEKHGEKTPSHCMCVGSHLVFVPQSAATFHVEVASGTLAPLAVMDSTAQRTWFAETFGDGLALTSASRRAILGVYLI